MVKQIIKRYQRKNLSWPKDWFIKFISVLFAIILWHFVTGEDRVDMNVQIPVEIVNLPRNLVISNQFKPQLDVTVSGPKGIIKKISEENISRSIDLTGASPGNIVIDNALNSIRFPRGIETLRINPTQFVILVDRLIKKTIPINPKSIGKLPADFILEGIILTPNTLTISGPQEILKNTTALNTRPIDLSDITKSSVKQISLDLLPEIANLIGESIVTAKVTINDKLVNKKIKHVPISTQGLVENRKAKRSSAKITIKANIPKALIRSTNKLTTLFEPFVDVTSLPDGTHELNIEVKTSPRIKIENISPKTVKITLKTEEIGKPITQ